MAETPAPTSLMLSPNDIVGVIRQGMGELLVYTNRPVPDIDPAICVAYLERMTGFALHLQQAMAQVAAHAGNKERSGARKN